MGLPMMVTVPPPSPLVKQPRRTSLGQLTVSWRRGRGFSIGEVRAAGLTVREARLLGIPVDEMRKTVWEANVSSLKLWLDGIVKGQYDPPMPRLPKHIAVKRKHGRVYRGLTSAGKRMRGLFATSLRQTHNYKWRKKARERAYKRRHEASRSKGGH